MNLKDFRPSNSVAVRTPIQVIRDDGPSDRLPVVGIVSADHLCFNDLFLMSFFVMRFTQQHVIGEVFSVFGFSRYESVKLYPDAGSFRLPAQPTFVVVSLPYRSRLAAVW